jgi:hypothetical protein
MQSAKSRRGRGSAHRNEDTGTKATPAEKHPGRLEVHVGYLNLFAVAALTSDLQHVSGRE